MQFTTLALALFAAAVSAQSTAQLISQIPSCAKPCLDDASTKIGCSTTDTSCQCSKIDSLTTQAIGCVSISCSADDLTQTTKLSAEICASIASDAGSAAASSAVSSAGSAATSVIASLTGATATSATTGATATPTGAGTRAVAGLGFAAAVAALAL
ncbi:hypothetical protein F5B19DRAFT_131349 [Rostrohypoxylon terebratum]|nr:hypothetical protein F5B19DRAFT_131349 [Rostrohypoxylon terebratum]